MTLADREVCFDLSVGGWIQWSSPKEFSAKITRLQNPAPAEPDPSDSSHISINPVSEPPNYNYNYSILETSIQRKGSAGFFDQ